MRPEDWKPRGVPSLDQIADRIVRGTSNMAVLAGPGAGKTETLAQRACFLLQTGACPRPRKILAVSYKRDSARLIRERVALRCPSEAARFHSVTFDGFAKQLLDRFVAGVPDAVRPSPNYEILFPKRAQVEEFLIGLRLPDQFQPGALRGLGGDTFVTKYLCARPFPFSGPPGSPEEFAAETYIAQLIRSDPSQLTFPMIARLAQAALLSNPLVLDSLRASYSHVFLDEFQDTSLVQYELLLTAFAGTGSLLTAVGDDKQRIMTFAGAMPDAFARFTNDFGAGTERPYLNYRSAPGLVRILRVLAESVEPGGAPMQVPEGKEAGGTCAIHAYSNPSEEAEHMASLIEDWIEGGLPAGEVCVITKMKPDAYAAHLMQELSKLGIRSRAEVGAADFLDEDLAVDCLRAMRLAAAETSPDEYAATISLMEDLYCQGQSDTEGARKVRARVAQFARESRDALAAAGTPEQRAGTVLDLCMNLFGRDRYCAANPTYAQGRQLDVALGKVRAHLGSLFASSADWSESIDEALGKNVVTVTTIHKSKGREYDSVVFLGLEDGAFFSFDREPDENMRAFFVAFSRAKARIIFTYSMERDGRPNRASKTRPLYEQLQKGGVEMTDLRDRKAWHSTP